MAASLTGFEVNNYAGDSLTWSNPEGTRAVTYDVLAGTQLESSGTEALPAGVRFSVSYDNRVIASITPRDGAALSSPSVSTSGVVTTVDFITTAPVPAGGFIPVGVFSTYVTDVGAGVAPVPSDLVPMVFTAYSPTNSPLGSASGSATYYDTSPYTPELSATWNSTVIDTQYGLYNVYYPETLTIVSTGPGPLPSGLRISSFSKAFESASLASVTVGGVAQAGVVTQDGSSTSFQSYVLEQDIPAGSAVVLTLTPVFTDYNETGWYLGPSASIQDMIPGRVVGGTLSATGPDATIVEIG